MASPKYDGVIEAIHFHANGQMDWVRVFLRRGPTFSDSILLDRSGLVALLKAGKRFWVGQRLARLASSFNLAEPLRLITYRNEEFLVVGNRQVEHDFLDGIPVI
jgi:hypothetical protein